MIEYLRSRIWHSVEKAGVGYGEYFEDGLLGVEDGKVVLVGHYDELRSGVSDSARIRHEPDCLVIPGFIDSHIHYPQYRVIASYGESLLEWLEKYTFPEEQKFASQAYAEKTAQLFFDQLLVNGTTSALTFCTVHPESVDAFFSEAGRRNMRMAGGKVMMDRNAPQALCDSADSSYRQSRQLIEKWHNRGRNSYALTPRFAPTSTPEQLQKAGQLLAEYAGNSSQKGVLLQTHLNENSDEIDWVSKLFPECRDYFGVYEHYGLAGDRSVFAHCVHNTESQLQAMARTGSGVALCPASNTFLGSGLFDLRQFDTHSIQCALATDVGGGDSFSMFRAMAEAYKVSQLQGSCIAPERLLHLATLAGAKVMNIDDQVGNFAVGKEADFQLLDLRATELIHQRVSVAKNFEELLFVVIMLGDSRLVKEVFIEGTSSYLRD